MLRTGLLWLSEQPRLFSIIRGNGLARRLASRFVAGETVEAAVAALTQLNAAGISASLDLLGESVAGAAEARAARDTYLETLDRIRRAGADANVSVKLTQMGLAIDEGLCVENLRAIIANARDDGSFVRIDMEQSDYTERTLQLFRGTFHPEFGNAVGVVLQSYLRRTERDVEDMIALGARVRLCKGAYQEPPAVAFPAKRDVDATFVRCMEWLLERGNYPGIATHDTAIIAHAKDFARERGVAPQPAAQHGRHFPPGGVHPVARPGAHQHDARAQGHRTSPPVAPAASMQRSSCRFTSCSVRASTGASASAGVAPQARYSVSRCPTGRSPLSDQRTNRRAAPYWPFAFGASSTNVATEYARPSVPPNAGARSCTRW